MKTIKLTILVLLSLITISAQEQKRNLPRPLNEVEYNIDEYKYELESSDPSSLLKPNDTINITWQKLNGPYGGTIGAIETKGDTIITTTGMDKGIVFFSTNRGLTWQRSNFKNESTISDFIFTDYGTVLAAGGTAGLFESSDMINWNKIVINNNPVYSVIYQLGKDSKGGIYFTSSNLPNIFYSKDSCRSWQVDLTLSSDYVSDFLLDNKNTLYASTLNKVYIKRADSTRWREIIINNSMDRDFIKLSMDENGNIYAKDLFGIKISTDQGLTWKERDTLDMIKMDWRDIDYNKGTLMLSGWPDIFQPGWGIMTSKDKGSTWEYSNEGLLPYSYAGRLATSGEDTYLGMYGGGIYRSTNQGDDWHPWMTGLAGASSWQITIDNKNNLYASTFGAGVQKSTDGGETWELLHNGLIDGRYYALLVDSSGKLYTGGDQGIFILNPGTTQWEKVYSGAMIALYGDGKGNVYGTDRYSGLVRSRDSGKTWENLNATDNQLFSFSIDQKGNLYVGQASGSIRRSTDNGLTWNTIKPSSSVYHVVNSVAVSKSGTIWAANDVQGLVKSIDDGTTWEVVIRGRAWRVFVNDKDEIFLSKQNRSTYPDGKEVFSDGGLFYSKDEGRTWSNITGNMQYIQVNDILFKDNGEILLSTDESIFKGSLPLGIETNKDEQVITEYSLSQNYPNPFNPSTTINYALPDAGYVTLKIYNTLGEELITLVNEYKQTGNHQVSFKAKDLSSGLYIYKLNANGKTFSKKMMLLK